VARLGPVELRRQDFGREGFTWSAPTTGEYAVCALWRHRPDVGHIQYFTLGRSANVLLQHVVDDFRRANACLVVANQHGEEGGNKVLRAEGFNDIEELVQLERPLGKYMPNFPGTMAAPLTFPRFRSEDVEATLVVEQDAFPWLWWSSAEDLYWYSRLSGVRVWSVRLAVSGDLIGTLGVTVRSVSGHIDRLAIRRAYQGQGFGRQTLEFALAWLRDQGVHRVTLTTQCANHRSRALYRAAGFIETPGQQFLLGRVLDPSVAPLLEAGRAL
jgi:RimJ/RimL family protein N-acetyltransferase